MVDKKEDALGLKSEELFSEAAVLTVAGSDTSGTGVCNTILHLIQDPIGLKKLRTELDAAISSGTSVTDHDQVKDLPYLPRVSRRKSALPSTAGSGSSTYHVRGERSSCAGSSLEARNSRLSTDIHHSPQREVLQVLRTNLTPSDGLTTSALNKFICRNFSFPSHMVAVSASGVILPSSSFKSLSLPYSPGTTLSCGTLVAKLKSRSGSISTLSISMVMSGTEPGLMLSKFRSMRITG